MVPILFKAAVHSKCRKEVSLSDEVFGKTVRELKGWCFGCDRVRGGHDEVDRH